MYTTQKETGKVAPTWNYAMLQARGTAKLHDDSEWPADQIKTLTAAREASQAEPWAVTDALVTILKRR
jgi:transcriptional regulator